jgi:hypothetical protein
MSHGLLNHPTRVSHGLHKYLLRVSLNFLETPHLRLTISSKPLANVIFLGPYSGAFPARMMVSIVGFLQEGHMNSLCEFAAFGLGCVLVGAASAVGLLIRLGSRNSSKKQGEGCLPRILLMGAVIMAMYFFILAAVSAAQV